MWLVDTTPPARPDGLTPAPGTRILFDPLLADAHHEGVFEVFPPRVLDVAALRPDLVVVTHRHPDHFDVASLAMLATLEPRPLLVTPDVLVGWAAERLGFEVCLLGTWEPLRLDGAVLLPTPSFCDVVEWGMLVATPDAVAWNQVDTELRSPADVRAVLGRAAELLERPALATGPDLAIVRWQPLRQISAVLGSARSFPTAGYRQQLDLVAATGARAAIPGAAGARYAPDYAWLDAHAFPVPEARFLRDLGRRCPGTAAWPARIGGRWHVGAAGTTPLDDEPTVRVLDVPDTRRFAPWSIPDLVDATPAAGDRAEVEAWLTGSLLPALAAHPSRLDGPARFALRVIYEGGPVDRTFVVSHERAEPVGIHEGLDEDYDAAVAITGSALAGVIAGRSHWGRPLLGGLLRATTRAYRVDEHGLHAAAIPPIFLYLGLSYDAAFVAWVEGQVAAHAPAHSPDDTPDDAPGHAPAT